MGQVLKLKPKAHHHRQYNADKQRRQDLLDQALSKAKSYNGIDYLKVLNCDEKENQRLTMRQHQDKMSLFF